MGELQAAHPGCGKMTSGRPPGVRRAPTRRGVDCEQNADQSQGITAPRGPRCSSIPVRPCRRDLVRCDILVLVTRIERHSAPAT